MWRSMKRMECSHCFKSRLNAARVRVGSRRCELGAAVAKNCGAILAHGWGGFSAGKCIVACEATSQRIGTLLGTGCVLSIASWMQRRQELRGNSCALGAWGGLLSGWKRHCYMDVNLAKNCGATGRLGSQVVNLQVKVSMI